ncbi:Sau3AI family type II restriction endonuclease [Clostridium fallax]|uniref:DNA mismatch repair protein MutH n=1 Tax=Clostridium fallax TaxID=1533 RepID=A0A1M4Z8A2_9CLOT|nr:Sau3AI family type II restriction endonuclease [Clostridium fallax]SHF14225.1 DNA mismatch repair protein MutH [Clostridium fallax]SQB07493.1 type II restriction endonuclease [Clostridium fallax]
MNIFNTEKELLDYTKNIRNKTFKELDKLDLLSKKSKDKGILGKIVETGFYNYPLNNNPSADFENLGIELKVAGLQENKNHTLKAKERLVLSKIDYNNIVNENFEFSKLLFKNKKLLIIWYEYDKNKTYADFIIRDFQLYDMSIDEDVFRNDFYIIKKKVVDGEAHLLSEGDTSYLGACTKGAKGTDRVSQPNSNIPAKPRAFSLKNSYMTGVLRSYGLTKKSTEFNTIEEYLTSKLSSYFRLTQKQIWSKLGFDIPSIIPKNFNKMISDKLIGKDSDLKEKHELFNKTTYIIKNIPVDENYNPIERLSFRNLILSEFTSSWEDSDWANYFEEVTIILICYDGKGKKNGDRILKGIKKITFSDKDLELFKKSYLMVQSAIINNDISILPYPKHSTEDKLDNPLVIAPKGKKGDNAYDNFFEKDTTKVCFMLEKEFIYNKLK